VKHHETGASSTWAVDGVAAALGALIGLSESMSRKVEAEMSTSKAMSKVSPRHCARASSLGRSA